MPKVSYMKQALGRLFAKTAFDRDELQARRAYAVQVVSLTLFVAALVGIFLYAILGNFVTSAVLVGGAIPVVAVFWFNYQHRSEAASLVFILDLLAVTTLLLYTGNGIHDTSILLYPLVIILATILFDQWKFALILVLIVASVALVVFSRLDRLDQVTTGLDDLVVVSIVVVIAGLVVNLLNKNLLSSLERARRSEQLLAQQAEQLEAAEARWRSLIQNALDLILTIDRQGVITFSSEEEVERWRHLEGRLACSLLPEALQEIGRDIINSIFETGQKATYEVPIQDALGRVNWYSVRIGPVVQDEQITRLVLIATNIQDRKIADEILHQRSEQLATLNRIGAATSRLLDQTQVLEEILKQTQAVMPLDVFYVALYDEESNSLSFPLMYDSGRRWQEPDIPLKGGRIFQVISSRRPWLVNYTAEQMASLQRGDDLRSTAAEKPRHSASIIIVPLIIGEKVIGALSVQSYQLDAYGQEHVDLLTAIASQVAIAIQNARLVEALRRELQERLLAEEAVRCLNEELEERVRQRTAELEEAIRDLEGFSYSVSHDLRAPLRSMAGYAQMLVEDYADQLSPEVQQYLNRIQAGARRMGQLIDDLLTFSRVSRKALQSSTFPARELVEQVLTDVLAAQDAGRVKVELGPLPDVKADRSLLRQVFFNLIDNALKYSSTRPVAQIEIGCQAHEGRTVFYVRDNGVGFDMQYAGKLFNVFERLHHAEDFEGTGVGLAIVKRIIERHGGKVWAESQPGQGATFYFTL